MDENCFKFVNEVANTKDLLKDKCSCLTEVEALQLAVQIQKNRILSDAFGVTNMDKVPAFLEAIAIAQGYNQ